MFTYIKLCTSSLLILFLFCYELRKLKAKQNIFTTIWINFFKVLFLINCATINIKSTTI